MANATVTSKGQITIPKNIRELLGLEAGDKVNFLINDQGAVSLIPLTKDVTTLKGLVTKPRYHVTVEDMKTTVKKRASKL
jgi:AbrB family looped-hinge helix DNA binding protein